MSIHSSVQGEQSNQKNPKKTKRKKLHVKAEELGNRFAFLVLLGRIFVWIRRDTQQPPAYVALFTLLGLIKHGTAIMGNLGNVNDTLTWMFAEDTELHNCHKAQR